MVMSAAAEAVYQDINSKCYGCSAARRGIGPICKACKRTMTEEAWNEIRDGLNRRLTSVGEPTYCLGAACKNSAGPHFEGFCQPCYEILASRSSRSSMATPRRSRSRSRYARAAQAHRMEALIDMVIQLANESAQTTASIEAVVVELQAMHRGSPDA